MFVKKKKVIIDRLLQENETVFIKPRSNRNPVYSWIVHIC